MSYFKFCIHSCSLNLLTLVINYEYDPSIFFIGHITLFIVDFDVIFVVDILVVFIDIIYSKQINSTVYSFKSDVDFVAGNDDNDWLFCAYVCVQVCAYLCFVDTSTSQILLIASIRIQLIKILP